MLNIYFNSKNYQEKKYILEVLIGEFLGLQFSIVNDSEEKNYRIELANDSTLIIHNYFWSDTANDSDYLRHNKLPGEIKFLKSQFCFESDLPVLYGNPQVTVENGKITCEVDLIAGSFFFLTRWEEYLSDDLDEHGRFKYKNSVSNKFNLIHRPVVDEYTEFLWNMLKYLDPALKRKERKYTPVITHDIDAPLRLMNLKMLRNSFFRNLIKRKNYLNALRDIPVYFINKITPNFDLGYCYDFLMDASESVGVKSNFFFINSPKTKFDPGYDNSSDIMQKIFNKIKSRGHIIGIHASYYATENPEIWRREYLELCEKTNTQITNGRHHYLRFKVPYTWQIWNENGLETDHTLGFAEMEGFRCGTSFSYPVYNFLTREKLKLRESPLIFMEVSVTEYQKIDQPNDFKLRLQNIVNVVKKYNGQFVFLYHNSFFDTKFLTHEKYLEWISIIGK